MILLVIWGGLPLFDRVVRIASHHLENLDNSLTVQSDSTVDLFSTEVSFPWNLDEKPCRNLFKKIQMEFSEIDDKCRRGFWEVEHLMFYFSGPYELLIR